MGTNPWSAGKHEHVEPCYQASRLDTKKKKLVPLNVTKNHEQAGESSPIEETFSKLKMHLRLAWARTIGALQEAICQALLTVTAFDAQGSFHQCGYLPAGGK